MMMTPFRYFIVFIGFTLFFSCSEDSEPIENIDHIEDCQVDDFYARMLINGECWISDIDYFRIDENSISIQFINDGALDENVLMVIPNVEISTIQFTGDRENSIYFSIIEGGDALVTSFEPRYSTEKELNWIQLEHINSDTTIISGRFEAVLYRNMPQNNQSIYPSPEKLVISDGQFKVQRRE
jgi:hypothetical protein